MAASLAAQDNLLSLEEYVSSGSVALYAAVHQEVDTALIFAAAIAAGKRVFYPALSGNEMLFRQVENQNSLRKGAYGIPEPCTNGIEYQADQAELIVVPGVAFDLTGQRVGYGKGYYDRFLNHSARKAHLVGLCHDFQLIDKTVPAEIHDIQMDIIVTDRRIIYREK